jgi:hypothetical protein
MPSIDDALRQAFEPADDEWVLQAPAALAAVRTRHRRHQVVRRSVLAGACAAAAVTAFVVADGGSQPRTIQPAVPTPSATSSPSSTPVPTAPLEGTWISRPLDADDVRAAAAQVGAPGSASRMLADLPDGVFRVVMVVRGSSLSTSVRSTGSADVLLDQESISTTGQQLELRPFDMPAVTLHQWVISGGVLTMSFVSTTERVKAGVPGEAWQRLLYNSEPLAHQDPQ